MKEKKAQIGNSLSWFIASIVIFFIMMLFIFGVINLGIFNENKFIFLLEKNKGNVSEEQRRLFFLFENSYEEKRLYDITKHHVLLIDKKSSKTKFEELKSSLDYFSGKKNCFIYFIIDSENKKNFQVIFGPNYYQNEVDENIYYFSYPENKKLPNKKTYSFFFPERADIIIKYVDDEC